MDFYPCYGDTDYTPSPLISWVNPLPSRVINRNIFFCYALESHECACCLLSFLYFYWLFPLSARETSSGNSSIYKSTRERVDYKGLCGRWRLHVMGSWLRLHHTSHFSWIHVLKSFSSLQMLHWHFDCFPLLSLFVHWKLKILLATVATILSTPLQTSSRKVISAFKFRLTARAWAESFNIDNDQRVGSCIFFFFILICFNFSLGGLPTAVLWPKAMNGQKETARTRS